MSCLSFATRCCRGSSGWAFASRWAAAASIEQREDGMPAADSNTTKARAIILTGAAGVLGTSMSLALLRAGHRVVLTDLDDAALQKLAETSGAPRENVVACAADLTTPAGPDSVVR